MNSGLIKTTFLITTFALAGFLFLGVANAQELPGLESLRFPGTVESIGTHFEITDSSYLNITLDSAEVIKLRIESMPEMVTMMIESTTVTSTTSTQITLQGFQPNTTYYKYQDDYHNLIEFTADNDGTYSYTQDLTTPHIVFIQPRKSTKFIKDDATGGDCAKTPNPMGTWDSITKTCVLTTDLNETIQIDSDGVNLDGNGYTMTGSNTGFGVYLSERTGVTIKNLNVQKFTSGIFLYQSSGNTLTGNTANSNNAIGIYLSSSNNNTLTGNTANSNNGYGIYLYYLSSNNILISNTAQENFSYDIFVEVFSDSHCNNTITNTIGSGGRPIKYFNGAVSLSNETLSELILCNADGSSINNITIDSSATKKNNGLLLIRTDFSTIANVNSSNNNIGISLSSSSNNTLTGNTVLSNNYYGIVLGFSSNNILTSNTASNNQFGIYLSSSNNNALTGNIANFNNNAGIALSSSSNNTLTDNTTLSSLYYGIFLGSSSNNILTGNTASNNFFYYGITLVSSNNNQIYKNNFISNSTQASVSTSGSGNIFNLAIPIGGNYWSEFDSLDEGCVDLNNNNLCDSPYVFIGGQDNLPWIIQNGWIVSQNQPPIVSNPNQYKSDGVTSITESSTTTDSTIILKATLNDPDNDQIKLQVELKEFNQSFNEQNLLESGFVNSGSETTITRNNLIDGQYHWRARATDDKGNASGWQEFGTAGNIDFVVQLPLSTKAAMLAKQLANHPEAYLWGGKGWDYNLDEFVASANILSGYTYYNPNKTGPNQGGFDFGIGVDCSGLITWAFNRNFDPFTPTADNFVKYVNANGLFGDFQSDTIAEANLLPGDAIFFDWNNDGFKDHTAIYVGESGSFDIVNARSRDSGIVTEVKDIYKELAGFQGFRRIHEGIRAMQITAGSPIDLVVTDPDDFTVRPDSIIKSDEEYIREIPGVLYYLEMERGADGNPIDRVYSPIFKTGDYTIQILPTSGTPPTATYTLDFSAGDQSVTLAQNVPISQIPSQGYGVTTSATDTISSFIPVLIDIKPDSYPNSINLKSNGVVPVAILGSATFDVGQIDLTTIKLANASVKLKNNGQPTINYEDINGDSFTDLVAHVITKDLQLTSNDTQAKLEGKLTDGTVIKGSDSVRIVP